MTSSKPVPAPPVRKSGFWTAVVGGIGVVGGFLTNAGVLGALPAKAGGLVGGIGAILLTIGALFHADQSSQ